MTIKREKDPTRDAFNEITQACPQSKMRFDPAIVPELIAWFLYHIDRHEKLRDANARVFQQTGMSKAGGIADHADKVIHVLNECVTWAGQMWKRPDWDTILFMMEKERVEAEKAAAEKPKQPQAKKAN